MRCNKSGQLQAWEALIIVILIGYGVYMTYLWGSKNTETKVFQKGSNAHVYEPSPRFGCSNLKIEEFYGNSDKTNR